MTVTRSTRTPITQSLFLDVSRDIKRSVKEGSYNVKAMADWYSVSEQTVRAIRQAGTWPQWERDKQERRTNKAKKQRATSSDSDELDKELKALGALTGASELEQLNRRVTELEERQENAFMWLRRLDRAQVAQKPKAWPWSRH